MKQKVAMPTDIDTMHRKSGGAMASQCTSSLLLVKWEAVLDSVLLEVPDTLGVRVGDPLPVGVEDGLAVAVGVWGGDPVVVTEDVAGTLALPEGVAVSIWLGV